MKIKIKVKNEKLLLGILIIILFILAFLYYNFIFSVSFAKESFTNDVLRIAEKNENSIFNIQKILLYSSATAVDNSSQQTLQDVSVNQFTDIAIYIDNTNYISELTNQNIVQKLYIDNIKIDSRSSKGTNYLSYKNPLNFGKFIDLSDSNNDRIDFNIVNTNKENETHDYSAPSFYTDCSNPITLGFLHKNVIEHFAVSNDSNTISFNGKVLKETNINPDDINYTLSFTINIINNSNEKFKYNMFLPVNFNDTTSGIYNGYSYIGKNTSGVQYNFFKEK